MTSNWQALHPVGARQHLKVKNKNQIETGGPAVTSVGIEMYISNMALHIDRD